MSNVAGNYYEYDTTILDTLETLHYIISAVDSSGNWNNTGTKDVGISDNDDPEIKKTCLLTPIPRLLVIM